VTQLRPHVLAAGQEYTSELENFLGDIIRNALKDQLQCHGINCTTTERAKVSSGNYQGRNYYCKTGCLVVRHTLPNSILSQAFRAGLQIPQPVCPHLHLTELFPMSTSRKNCQGCLGTKPLLFHIQRSTKIIHRTSLSLSLQYVLNSILVGHHVISFLLQGNIRSHFLYRIPLPDE